MFSTGNFKNSVGATSWDLAVGESHFKTTLPLQIELTRDYSWVAMDETAKKDADIRHLAPSVVHATKSMFIIRVQYYVQIVFYFGLLQRPISVKLPFLLKRPAEGAAGVINKEKADNKKQDVKTEAAAMSSSEANKVEAAVEFNKSSAAAAAAS